MPPKKIVPSSYADAVQTFDRLYPDYQRSTEERERLLNLHPVEERQKITDLVRNHAHLAQEYDRLLAQQGEVSSQLPVDIEKNRELERRLAALHETLTRVGLEIVALSENTDVHFDSLPELLKAETNLATLRPDIEAASRTIRDAAHNEHNISERLAQEEEKYQETIQAKERAQAAARERYSMDAVENFEQHALPEWQRLQTFLNEQATAKHEGRPFSISNLPELDTAAIARMVGALTRFPPIESLDVFTFTLEAALRGYMKAVQDYQRVSETGDTIRAAQILRTQLEPSLEQLRDTGGLRAEWMNAYHAAYTKDLAHIEEEHAPAIAAAETQLFNALAKPADRQDLAMLRMGEEPSFPEHPLVEKLRTAEGRRQVLDHALAELGLPLKVDAVKTCFEAFSGDIQENGVLTGKKKVTKSATADSFVEALRQTVTQFVDQSLLSPELKKSATERANRLGLTGPKPAILDVLATSVFPEKDGSQTNPRTRLDIVLGSYVSDLKPVVTALNNKDTERAEQEMRDALNKLNDLETKFGKLLSGDIQDAQAKAGVAPANRALPKEDYIRLLVEAEESNDPRPSPETRRQTMEGSVNAFVASMERATALETQSEAFRLAKRAVRAASERGMITVSRVQALTTRLEETERTVEKLGQFHATRGFEGDDASASTERNALITEWNQTHAAEVTSKEAAEKKAKTDVTRAEQALQTAEQNPHFKQIVVEKDRLEQLLFSLRGGDVRTFFAANKERDALLKEIHVVITGPDGKETTLSASAVVNQVAAQQRMKPLAGVNEWIAPSLRTLPFSRFTHTTEEVDTVLQSAFSVACQEAAPVGELAEWFQKNGSVGIFRRFSKAESNPTLIAKAQALKSELEKSCAAVARERDAALQELQAAGDAPFLRQSKLRILDTITARASAFKEILAQLESDLSNTKNIGDGVLLNRCMRALAATVYEHTGEDVADPSLTESANVEGFKLLNTSIQRLKEPLPQPELVKLVSHVKSDVTRLNAYSSKLPEIAEQLEHAKLFPSSELSPAKGALQTISEVYEEIVATTERITELRNAVDAAKAQHVIAEQELTEKRAETLETALAAFDAATIALETSLDPTGTIAQDVGAIRSELKAATNAQENARKEFVDSIERLVETYATWLEKKPTLLPANPSAATESEKILRTEIQQGEADLLDLLSPVNPPQMASAPAVKQWWSTLEEQQKINLGRQLAPALFSSKTT